MAIRKVKEKFGLEFGLFAPIKTKSDSGLPTYGEPVDTGAMVLAHLTVSTTNAKVYGDDALALAVDQFVSGELTIEGLKHTLEMDSALYGSSIADEDSDTLGRLTDNANDNPPEGGYGYIQKLMGDDKVVYYRAVILPRVQAQMTEDNADTKAESLTFSHNKTKFTVMAQEGGDWRYRAEFSGEGARANAILAIKTAFGNKTG